MSGQPNAPIRVLDEQTANRIAAGEVVERPVSVVKELVENSLDAGATAVTVDIATGGIESIRVTDNGSGIPAGFVRLAFERHATSKISSGDALDDIGTLGFRGEALPSIASVARVVLTTRTQGGEGVRISAEGGHVSPPIPAGAPQGTTVVVRDLFFNTPARRKFLRRPSAEAGAVGDLIIALALSRPDVSFRFSQGGRTAFHTPGDGKIESVLQTVFGSATSAAMIRVDGASGYVRVSGYVGVGEASRGSRQYELISVNGRTVRCAVLWQGVEAAVRERVMIGRFPVCALHVSVPSASVDVNCHPAKTEVRFADENYVRQAVYDVIAAAVAAHDAPAAIAPPPPAQEAPPKQADIAALTPGETPQARIAALKLGAFRDGPETPLSLYDSAAAPKPQPSVQSQPAASAEQPVPQEKAPAASAAQSPVQEEREQQPLLSPPEPPAPQDAAARYELLGQVFLTYLLVRANGRLLVIDQHAAHERILYDRLMAAYSSGGQVSQRLLVPRIFDVSVRDKARIMDSAATLAEAGFEVEEFGPNSVRVSAVPVILGEPQLKDFFTEYVDRLGELRQALPEREREQIIYMACRSAVKGGDMLASDEIRALLTQLFVAGRAPTCPHGRPIVIEITEKELERRFGRIQ